MVPADQGPPKIPWMPRPQTIARMTSVENHSDAKSATAIGPQRSNRCASSRPSPRKPMPRPSQGRIGPFSGWSMSGGVRVRSRER